MNATHPDLRPFEAHGGKLTVTAILIKIVALALPVWTRWFGLESTIRAAVAPLKAWARARAAERYGRTG